MSVVQRSTVDAVRLVTVREIQARLRSKAFVVSAAILLVMVVAGIVVAGIVGRSTANATTPVAVVSGVSLPSSDGLDVTRASDRAAAEQLVRDGEVDAAIVPDGGQLGFRVVGLDSAPTDVVQALSVSPRGRPARPRRAAARAGVPGGDRVRRGLLRLGRDVRTVDRAERGGGEVHPGRRDPDGGDPRTGTARGGR
ncbi:hypothetical protein [Curtobacterium sp. MCPF17_052]|uniref:hypothetical protein n=1 Tax=Curtobacterium sp. MCPF17_052 TaxID=2175655 RepID=UPI003463C163